MGIMTKTSHAQQRFVSGVASIARNGDSGRKWSNHTWRPCGRLETCRLEPHQNPKKLGEWWSPFADWAKTGAIAENKQNDLETLGIKICSRYKLSHLVRDRMRTKIFILWRRRHGMWNPKTTYWSAHNSLYPFDLNDNSRLSSQCRRTSRTTVRSRDKHGTLMLTRVSCFLFWETNLQLSKRPLRFDRGYRTSKRCTNRC